MLSPICTCNRKPYNESKWPVSLCAVLKKSVKAKNKTGMFTIEFFYSILNFVPHLLLYLIMYTLLAWKERMSCILHKH
jgi:hypothetical protein